MRTSVDYRVLISKTDQTVSLGEGIALSVYHEACDKCIWWLSLEFLIGCPLAITMWEVKVQAYLVSGRSRNKSTV